MSQEKRAEAAQKIADKLFAAEAALDQAITSNAAVMAELMTAIQPGALTVFHCQEPLEQATEVAALLTKGRRQIGSVHRALEATHRQIGLGPSAFGPIGKPPAGEPLREVSSAQVRDAAA
jgi:hypothetical protein